MKKMMKELVMIIAIGLLAYYLLGASQQTKETINDNAAKAMTTIKIGYNNTFNKLGKINCTTNTDCTNNYGQGNCIGGECWK